MSNDAQVDAAKEKPALTPRPTMDPQIPGCMGDWKPVGVKIVTDADESEYGEG